MMFNTSLPTGVQYFAGPQSWKGLNFRLGTVSEYNELISSFENTKHLQDEEFNNKCSLYIINTKAGEEIKILANKDRLFLVKNLPKHLE